MTKFNYTNEARVVRERVYINKQTNSSHVLRLDIEDKYGWEDLIDEIVTDAGIENFHIYERLTVQTTLEVVDEN